MRWLPPCSCFPHAANGYKLLQSPWQYVSLRLLSISSTCSRSQNFRHFCSLVACDPVAALSHSTGRPPDGTNLLQQGLTCTAFQLCCLLTEASGKNFETPLFFVLFCSSPLQLKYFAKSSPPPAI